MVSDGVRETPVGARRAGSSRNTDVPDWRANPTPTKQLKGASGSFLVTGGHSYGGKGFLRPTVGAQSIAGNSGTQRVCDTQTQRRKRAWKSPLALGVKGQRAGGPQQNGSRVC